MSYTALARKWRPRTFSQLLGQDHVKKALTNSLRQGRLHHAYLFTGTRGVGKTSVARLFAKSLNCEQGISATPCLECSNCIAIEQGHCIDLIEVDGASRTRVEDTRELLENIQYVPSSGRFKIYLIDEVHMLSQHSFNALLKTLEEPPEHVKFLLATTDPQKLPITVLSRCLQFNLKHLAVEEINRHLQTILEEEKLDYEADALNLIARAAQGSVRDALSLLDQAIVSCNEKLCTDEIKQLLGYSQQDYALQLLHALGELNPHKMLTISKQIALEGGPFHYVLEELLHHLHQISIYQNVKNSGEFLINSSETQVLANQFTREDTQLFYQIAIKSQEDMHLAPSPVIAFDMMLLRMYTFKPASLSENPLLTCDINQPSSENTSPFCDAINEDSEALTSEPSILSNELIIVPPNSVAQLNSTEATITEWGALLSQLNLSGLTLSAAENAEFIEKNNHQITLRVEKGYASVFTSAVISRLESALTDHYHEPIKISLQHIQSATSTPATAKRVAKENQLQRAETALEEDPFFQRLQQEFSAELVKTSIAPLKDSL